MQSTRTLQGCTQNPGSLWRTAVICGLMIVLVVFPMVYPALGQLGMGLHGKKIYQEMDHISTWEAPCTPLSEESFANVWSQTDFDGIRRVHLQVLSDNQQLSFPDNPPALSLDNHSDNAVICRGPNGGAYVAWAERRGGDQWGIMLQRIDGNGSPVWRQGGIEVTEVSNPMTPGLRIYFSSEENCFVEILDDDRMHGYIVFAYNQAGETIEGWPLRNYEISILIPDNEGGFWFRNVFNEEGNRLIRVSRNGGIADGSPFRLESPAHGYQIIWHTFPCVLAGIQFGIHYGIQIGTDYIFAVWEAGISQPTIIGVYDFSGELQRLDTLLAPFNDEAADYLSIHHIVTPDNRFVAVYNHLDERRIGDDGFIQTPMYAPRLICYAPFEENRFPFGRNEQISIGSHNSLASDYRINLVGENYFVGGYAFDLFDHNGQRLRDGDSPLLGALFPIGDKSWVKTNYSAFLINENAEREGDEEIVEQIPNLRERGRTLIFPTENGGCDILMVDKYRGLAGQDINSEGRLSENLGAGVRIADWINGYGDEYGYGSLTTDL